MQLVEEGKLRLDDPINEHLPPALRIPDNNFDEPIRVRNLMTHTAGFEDSVLGHLFVREPARVLSVEDYLVRYRVRRARPPGHLSVYSNYGAALAGAIVAHESGIDWPTYAERRILRPLGMMSATFREPYSAEVAATNHLPQPMPAEIAARVTQGYRFHTGGFEAAPFEFVTHGSPAGSLSASANDMALYMQALLDPARMAGAGVLSEPNARALSVPLFANHPALGAWRHGFMSFDLGGGRWAFGHGGSTIYQHSIMMVSRELGLGVFVSTNTDTGYRMLGPFSQALVREFYPATEEPVRADAAKADAARYAGTYRPFRRAYHRTERAVLRLVGAVEISAAQNGDLIVTGGPEPQRFLPLGGGVYRSATSPARGAFREAGGRMRLYDAWGLGPMERIGFFESSKWLGLIAGLGAVVALWGVTAGARRAIARKETAGDLLFDGLCLYWLAAFGLFAAALAPWVGSDESAIVFDYPGLLFPIACWALASAALATLLAIAAHFVVRPKWSWLRWLRAGSCASVFGALSLTLWSWGFLGYSGF
jgi:CubicO group peptidase (beta-lactamase class C family)